MGIEEGICLSFISQNVVVANSANALFTSLTKRDKAHVVVIQRFNFKFFSQVEFFGEPSLLVDPRQTLPIITQIFIHINSQIAFQVHSYRCIQ